MAIGVPALCVYPLAFVELDDELSIHYLHHPRPFPVLLRRRDGRPFQRIRFGSVNSLFDEDLDLTRDIWLQGVYGYDTGVEGKAPER